MFDKIYDKYICSINLIKLKGKRHKVSNIGSLKMAHNVSRMSHMI